MEQNMQHKIEVLTKRRFSKLFWTINLLTNVSWTNFLIFLVFIFRKGSKLLPYINTTCPPANHRNSFQLIGKLRKRQLFHQKWRTFHPYNQRAYRSPGSYAILWELEKVDRQIQKIQSEIFVLKQQLKIAQTYNAPAAPVNSQPNTDSKPNTGSKPNTDSKPNTNQKSSAG